MVVVGGHNSGNTSRLASVARSEGVRTVHVETEKELDPAWFSGVETVGVTAGASTPNWMITCVIRELERISRRGDTSFTSVSRRVLRLLLRNLYAPWRGSSADGGPAPEHRSASAFSAWLFLYPRHAHAQLFREKVPALQRRKGALPGTLPDGLLGSGILSNGLSLILGLRTAGGVRAAGGHEQPGLLYACRWGQIVRFSKMRRLKDIPAQNHVPVRRWAPAPDLSGPQPQGPLAAPPSWWPDHLSVVLWQRLGDIMEIQGDRMSAGNHHHHHRGNQDGPTARLTLGLMILALVWAGPFGLLTSLPWPAPCVFYDGFYILDLFPAGQLMGVTFFEALVDATSSGRPVVLDLGPGAVGDPVTAAPRVSSLVIPTLQPGRRPRDGPSIRSSAGPFPIGNKWIVCGRRGSTTARDLIAVTADGSRGGAAGPGRSQRGAQTGSGRSRLGLIAFLDSDDCGCRKAGRAGRLFHEHRTPICQRGTGCATPPGQPGLSHGSRPATFSAPWISDGLTSAVMSGGSCSTGSAGSTKPFRPARISNIWRFVVSARYPVIDGPERGGGWWSRTGGHADSCPDTAGLDQYRSGRWRRSS
jgi:hypothetical protein